MKKFIICLFSLLSLFSVNAQQTYLFSTNSYVDGIQSTIPTRNVKMVDDGVIVTYEFTGFTKEEDPLYPNSYQLKIDGFGQNSNEGEPALPVRWDSFIIPDGSNAIVEIIDSIPTFFSIDLALRNNDTFDNNHNDMLNNSSFVSDTIFPSSIKYSNEILDFRGQTILYLGTTPIKYYSESKNICFYKKLSYKIKYIRRSNMQKALSSNKKLNKSDVSLISNVLNYSEANYNETETMQYLIVSHPKYKEAVERFARWKRLLGFDINVLYGNSLTNSYIKQEIDSWYNSSPNPMFLLLFGNDEDVAPSHKWTKKEKNNETGEFYTINCVSDLYYGCMGEDNNDYVADIYYGRITVNNIDEANVVVDKIINYESNPVSDYNFYKTGISCAEFQTSDSDTLKIKECRAFVLTSEKIRSYLQENFYYNIKPIYAVSNYASNPLLLYNGDSIASYLRKPVYTWKYHHKDIIREINKGAFYVMHRGHGHRMLWGFPHFDIYNVESLSNKEKLPVVFSINCNTGEYNNGTSLSEALLTKKSGGAIAVFAATAESYSLPNDAMSVGMINAIWPFQGTYTSSMGISNNSNNSEPTFYLGQILQQGLFSMRTNLYNDYNQYKVYHLFGDPSMEIRTSLPTRFSDSSIVADTDKIWVNISDSARIVFLDNDSDEIKVFCGNTANYNVNEEYDITICLYAHNKIPYINRFSNKKILFLQNERFSENIIINGDIVKIGNKVTSTKTFGDVFFEKGNIVVSAKEITLDAGTNIELGTNVELKTIEE